ncbi:MAG: hypothetical protein ACXWJV_08155 [Hyphomicrobium sp.]
MALFLASMLLPEGGPVPVIGTLTEPAKEALNFILELSKLIATVNGALFAGALTLVLKGKEWSGQWSRFHGYILVAILLSGGASYYGIYLGHVAVLGTVVKGTVNPFEPRLQAALMIQYYGTLLGVFLLGLLVTLMMEGRVTAVEVTSKT